MCCTYCSLKIEVGDFELGFRAKDIIYTLLRNKFHALR